MTTLADPPVHLFVTRSPGGAPAATVPLVRVTMLVLVILGVCACAGCSTSTPGSTGSASSASAPAVSTKIVSVDPSSQLGDEVTWTVTNKTHQAQLATCEVLVLDGSTQLGDYGPVQLAVAAGATAEEYSQVTTLAGSSTHDVAQVVCQKGLIPTVG